ncbi:MAG: hypothetical protein K5880_22975 [Hydrogenophaga sp.]|uniref:hypothetical protein n=1 Tax=Hydrogenophaga sp. TaxID=1904254 RepID=UPI00262B5D22|nr:hypothetical protein [Hydrogenophaga sp.]MCV0441461.1 hypothetical protein [Hydrogenophaga sp.]
MESDPNLNPDKALTKLPHATFPNGLSAAIREGDFETPTRFHVHGNAFMPGDRLRWVFDFSITVEAADDEAAQARAFEVFTEYDIDLTEIEEADPCE